MPGRGKYENADNGNVCNGVFYYEEYYNKIQDENTQLKHELDTLKAKQNDTFNRLDKALTNERNADAAFKALDIMSSTVRDLLATNKKLNLELADLYRKLAEVKAVNASDADNIVIQLKQLDPLINEYKAAFNRAASINTESNVTDTIATAT